MKNLQIENLVFSGGGIKGIAYLGAIQEVLQNSDKIDISNVKRTGGTSAGSILAALYAVYNGNSQELKKLMDADFSQFEDLTPFGKEVESVIKNFKTIPWGLFFVYLFTPMKFTLLPVALHLHREISDILKQLFTKFDATKVGIWKGDAFKKWLENSIDDGLEKASLKITSKELTFKAMHDEAHFKMDPYLVGTNLNTGYPEIFSYENTPDMLVADAVRISMSIPIFFESIERPVTLADGTQKNCLYADGGVVWNYPIEIFDQRQYVADYKPGPYGNLMANPKTMGFKLDSQEHIDVMQNPSILKHYSGAPMPKTGLEYAGMVINDLMNSQNFSMLLFSRNESRTVNVSGCGIPATEFKLTKEQEDQLFKSGVEGVKQFLTRTFG
ncbi:MAG: patatin-like phospholipase family protein [Desulfobacteraceae bacterium]|nr:patatin-like phospholipase family protein [Desulfobacteraceae bacterium]